VALYHDNDIVAVMQSGQPLRFVTHVMATAEARAWDEVSMLEQVVVSQLVSASE
jgi:hypothetical protein